MLWRPRPPPLCARRSPGGAVITYVRCRGEAAEAVSMSPCFTVLFVMPMVVALLQCTGVLGWGCPISSRVSQKNIPSLQLRKRAPSSASAADATTKRRMVHNVKNTPFNLIGSPSLGDHPMKKWLHARLCAFVSER